MIERSSVVCADDGYGDHCFCIDVARIPFKFTEYVVITERNILYSYVKKFVQFTI